MRILHVLTLFKSVLLIMKDTDFNVTLSFSAKVAGTNVCRTRTRRYFDRVRFRVRVRL